MSAPRPTGQDDERITPRRLAVFGVVAVAIIVGVYFYFRYGAQMTPVLGLVVFRS